jgi:hypothetical protein
MPLCMPLISVCCKTQVPEKQADDVCKAAGVCRL